MGIQERIRHSCENSSIKCLPKLVSARTKLQKSMWILTLVTGVVVAGIQIVPMFQDYAKHQTTRSTTVEKTYPGTFPQVTFCNLNPLWTTINGSGLESDIYGTPRQLTFDEYINDILFQYLARKLQTGEDSIFLTYSMYSVSGYMKHVKLNDTIRATFRDMFVWECVWHGENGLEASCHTDEIQPFLSPANGLCFTITQPPRLRSIGRVALAVIVYVNDMSKRLIAAYKLSPFVSFSDGILVKLQTPGTAPYMRDGIMVTPGHEAYIDARRWQLIQLDTPYSNCTYPARLPTFEGVRDPNEIWTFTKPAFEDLSLQREVLSQCGCLANTLLTYPELRDRHRFCGIYRVSDTAQSQAELECMTSATTRSQVFNDQTCSCRTDGYETAVQQATWPRRHVLTTFYHLIVRPKKPSSAFDVIDDILAMYDLRNATQQEEAATRLDEVKVIGRNFLQVSVYLQPEETTYTEQPSVLLFNTIGSVGGILNLWVGVTFITFMEIVDFCLVSCMAKKTHWNRKPLPTNLESISSKVGSEEKPKSATC